MILDFFTSGGVKAYVQKARAILDSNWTGSYTKPSPALYPHQWNWDSGFIAIGYAHYNQRRAQTELLSLFSRQWNNGMVPQICFNAQALGNYFPEPDFWQVPDGRLTSGITMPPIHAVAVLRIYEKARDKETAKAFCHEMFPRLMASHRYFYEHRDPQRSGLAYIRHPWESGLDNSPAWDEPLAAMAVDKARLPPYERKDLKHGVPAEQRPSDEDYGRYVYLVDIFRRLGYDEAAIWEECPFKIQDVLLNSILCRAGAALEEIGRITGRDAGQAREWRQATQRAIGERMWSEERGQFEPFCLVGRRPLSAVTAAGFMPLYAGAAGRVQAEKLYQRIDSVSFCALHQGNCFTIPNFDMAAQGFDPRNYWRGPVWININWMLSQGLKGYGFRVKADSMQKDMIQLPVRFGFFEYFDSRSGQGHGSQGFSWTAALFIDLVNEYYAQDRSVFRWLSSRRERSLRRVKALNVGSGEEEASGPDLAADLMHAIGRLKKAYYNTGRGRVDYGAMKDSSRYREYLLLAARLNGFDPRALKSQEERLAFWINLYNTIVVHGIVELGITASVREVNDFFVNLGYAIGGEVFTLDAIEHGILRSNARPPYRFLRAFPPGDSRRDLALDHRDPRIHFALVCGSRSCAPIGFYDPAAIHDQLDQAAHHFVDSSEVVILPEENKMLLSQIFKWYSRDFGGREGVLDFLIKYLDPGPQANHVQRHRESIRIEHLFYDWNLNH